MAASDPPVPAPAPIALDGASSASGQASPRDVVEFRLCPKEPSQHLLWFFGGFVLVAAFAWINDRIDGQFLLWGGGIALIMFIAARMDETKAVEDRSVKVRVSREGLAISEKFHGTISWDEIEKISSSSHKGQTTLGIILVNPEALGLAPQSGWSKFWMGAGIQYNITALEGDPDEVLGAIRWLAPPRLTESL